MIKRFIPFFFAGVLGLIGVFMTRHYIAQQLAEQQQLLQAERKELRATYEQLAQSSVEIVVANADLPEGTKISAKQLGVASIPQNYVQPYAASRAADVLGFVTIAPIAKGEQILRNKLRTTDEILAGAKLSDLVLKGKRAVTIGTDVLTGVGGLVRPGDRVDILWTFEPHRPGEPAGEAVTVTLFQNVKVLAVGDKLVGASDKKGWGKSSSDRSDNNVTVALTPQETSLLLYARREGVVQLSLRSELEHEGQEVLDPTSMSTVLKTLLKQKVMEPKPPVRTVEVIRGLEQSVVAISE